VRLEGLRRWRCQERLWLSLAASTGRPLLQRAQRPDFGAASRPTYLRKPSRDRPAARSTAHTIRARKRPSIQVIGSPSIEPEARSTCPWAAKRLEKWSDAAVPVTRRSARSISTRGPTVPGDLAPFGSERSCVSCAPSHRFGRAGPEPFSSKSCRFYMRVLAGRAAVASRASDPVRRLAVWQERWLTGAVLDRQLEYIEDATLRAAFRSRSCPLDRPRRCDNKLSRRPPVFEPFSRMRRRARAAQSTGGRDTLHDAARGVSRSSPSLHGQDDQLVGSFVANRNRVEIEKLIGCFANTLVSETTCPRPTSRTARPSSRDDARGLRRTRISTFDRLVVEVRPDVIRPDTPIFQMMFILQNVPAAIWSCPKRATESSVWKPAPRDSTSPWHGDEPGTSTAGASMRPTCTTARRSSDS